MTSSHDILDLAEILVDQHVGIIRRVQEIRKEAGAPDFVYFLAETCNISAVNSRIQQGPMFAAGVSMDRRRALSKAIGESIERYCAAIYSDDNLPIASYESAPFPCVPPEDFTLFSTDQYAQPDFPFSPYNKKSNIRWFPSKDLCTGTRKYVPAAKVFLPYVCYKEVGEHLITPQISTGLACHTNHSLAALTAICEVIEREAIAITWQAHWGRTHIRLNSLSPQNIELIKRLNRTGATISLLHLAMDHGVPVILSVMTNSCSSSPAFLMGAAAHPCPDRAIQKSLEELAQIWQLSQQTMYRRGKFSNNGNWNDIVTSESHAAIYYDHKNAKVANFLFAQNEQIDFDQIKSLSTGDPEKDLRTVVECVQSVNATVYLADVTSEDVSALGIFVVRAVIPSFHPLFMGHNFRPLGGKRLWEVPQKLGYPGINPKKGDNPYPHPFA